MAGDLESDAPISINLEKLRQLIRKYIEKHQYETAVFWANKVASLSNGEVQDVYWYAQTLYHNTQYHRAAHLLKSYKMDKRFLAGRYLAAKCHFECKEWQEALDTLDQVDTGVLGVKLSGANKKVSHESHADIPSQNMESSINLLRGKIYEAMDNRNLAVECFREALRADVYCFEAFDNLVNHHMMTAQEERELLESLPFNDEDEVELVRFLYENRVQKYDKPSVIELPSRIKAINDNMDVVVSQAERHYYNCDFRDCFDITTRVLSKDPYNSQCLPLHIAVLVELKKPNNLFYLAHKLVDLYPDEAVAWFAVGCYYLLVGKNDPARRYLSKATTLDRVYGPAWLAFGHSFAAENEHDQAMAAYFTASQLMRGCHLPMLYIGLEYGLTNNSKLAERFFSQALTIAPEDPFVLHEMGVTAFQNKDYEQAESHFKSALEKILAVKQEVVADKWEPLLNNLGHVCRKLKKYKEALDYHRQALVLCPMNPSTLSAIGYVHALTGDCAEALDFFHKALGLRRDDTFSTSMFNYAIEQLMGDAPPVEGIPDVLPPFTFKSKVEKEANDTTQSETDFGIPDTSSMVIDSEMEDT